MPLLILEPHDLVLDGRAVPWTLRRHPAPVRRGLVKILLDHPVRLLRGIRQVAAHLLPGDMVRGVVGEPPHVLVPLLLLKLAEVDCPPVHPWGGARLQALRLKPEGLQLFREADARGLPRPPRGGGLLAHPNPSVHKSPRGDDHRVRQEGDSEVCDDPLNLVVWAELEVDHHGLPQGQVRARVQHVPHLSAVEVLVRLRPE
mmetsp:Transcript_7057/g.24278  ORF Transcript_7057/g.24278 Transcript_7057/m.24278 type:complete len:201 (+) Transcript_7057:3084-3686(+)